MLACGQHRTIRLLTDEAAPPEGNDMQRFFTEPNLGRYKELASGLLTPQERRITLEFLAAELAKQRCLEMAKGCGTG